MKRMVRYGRGLGLALLVVLGACASAQVQGGGSDAPAPLAGTSWVLTELNGQPPVSAGGTLTLQFAADGTRVSGNGGCNQFNGPYTQNGASVRIGSLVSTRRACLDPAGNAQETAYLQALESTTRASIVGGRLVLYRGTQVVARFRSAG
jgi:heat shock protein HslJ